MHTDDIPIFCNWFSLYICKRLLFLTPNEYSVIALCQKNMQIFHVQCQSHVSIYVVSDTLRKFRVALRQNESDFMPQ